MPEQKPTQPILDIYLPEDDIYGLEFVRKWDEYDTPTTIPDLISLRDNAANYAAKQFVDWLKAHNMEKPYHSKRLELSGADYEALVALVEGKK